MYEGNTLFSFAVRDGLFVMLLQEEDGLSTAVLTFDSEKSLLEAAFNFPTENLLSVQACGEDCQVLVEVQR